MSSRTIVSITFLHVILLSVSKLSVSASHVQCLKEGDAECELGLNTSDVVNCDENNNSGVKCNDQSYSNEEAFLSSSIESLSYLDNNLQAPSAVSDENNAVLYDDPIDYVPQTTPEYPSFRSQPNGGQLSTYEPISSKNSADLPARRFENPILANGLIGWVGTNVAALMNYFDEPARASETGSLVATLAQANMEYVTEGLPKAVMDGLAEKQHRKEVEQQRLKQTEYGHRQQETRNQQNMVYQEAPSVGPYDEEQNQRIVDHKMLEGMGIEVNHGMINDVHSMQDNPQMEQQKLRINPSYPSNPSYPMNPSMVIDPSLPIQQQLYYQQLLYDQQHEESEPKAMILAGNNHKKQHGARRTEKHRKLNRHMLSKLFT